MFPKSLAIALITTVVSSTAYAGEQYGNVSRIAVRSSDGLHYFWLEGESTNKPACATISYWMIADENSTAGKSQLSMILSAHAQQKPIRVVGTGKCTRWSDGEDVDFLSIQ